MTHAKLRTITRRWVPWWRDKLGLRDWHLDVEYFDPNEDSEKMGSCEPDYAHRTAKVRLLAATTPMAQQAWDKHAPEEVIVHELLHIHFGTFGVGLNGHYSPGKLSKAVQAESVINALATCLVARRRGKR